MSIYKQIVKIGLKFLNKRTLFKHGFNWSPMYRRTTARVIEASEDLLFVKVKIPLSYKNRNYMNTMFGGTMFSSVDPIPLIQLIDLLGDDYIVWDRSAEIVFKKPGTEDLYAEFTYTLEEVDMIRTRLKEDNEMDIVKITYLTNKDKSTTFCEIRKTIYVADKTYYKEKIRQINQ